MPFLASLRWASLRNGSSACTGKAGAQHPFRHTSGHTCPAFARAGRAGKRFHVDHANSQVHADKESFMSCVVPEGDALSPAVPGEDDAAVDQGFGLRWRLLQQHRVSFVCQELLQPAQPTSVLHPLRATQKANA